VLSGNGKALKMSSIHLLFAICFMGGVEGRGKWWVLKTMSKSPFQELGFLTEKKKENSFMSAEQKLNYIC
jgi:hypothetical protein